MISVCALRECLGALDAASTSDGMINVADCLFEADDEFIAELRLSLAALARRRLVAIESELECEVERY